eukprot:1812790-Pyramimonas_sp.AAC.1
MCIRDSPANRGSAGGSAGDTASGLESASARRICVSRALEHPANRGDAGGSAGHADSAPLYPNLPPPPPPPLSCPPVYTFAYKRFWLVYGRFGFV